MDFKLHVYLLMCYLNMLNITYAWMTEMVKKNTLMQNKLLIKKHKHASLQNIPA